MEDLLITGSLGQLGRAALEVARTRGLSAAGHDLDTLDITNEHAVAQCFAAVKPRAVINCAAFTAVDACESDELTACAVNGAAVGVLARACNSLGALLVQISTDYVFPGDGKKPYVESDPTGPVSAYGRSKLEGELMASEAKRHLIVRTAWLCGRGGRNFVEAIRHQVEAATDPLRVVADQTGSPTFCDDLAEAVLDLVDSNAVGVVHAVNHGVTTWHGFASEIVRQLDAPTSVLPVSSSEFPRPARRPAYSVLDTTRLQRLIGRTLPPWQEALARYLSMTAR